MSILNQTPFSNKSTSFQSHPITFFDTEPSLPPPPVTLSVDTTTSSVKQPSSPLKLSTPLSTTSLSSSRVMQKEEEPRIKRKRASSKSKASTSSDDSSQPKRKRKTKTKSKKESSMEDVQEESKNEHSDGESENDHSLGDRSDRNSMSEHEEKVCSDTECHDNHHNHSKKNSKQATDEDEDSECIDLDIRPKWTMAQTHEINSKHEFFLVMYNSTPFKDLISLITDVLENISIKVVTKQMKSGEPFKGITINSMDSKKVSMIVARLKFDEIFPPTIKDQSFCVSSKVFASLVETIKPGCCLELKKEKGSNSVDIRGYNPNKRNYESDLSISTLDSVEDAPRLDIIGYNFVIDMDLDVLRKITRLAQKQHIEAEYIVFEIFQGVDEKLQVKNTKICISLDVTAGASTTKVTLRSVTKWEKQNSDQTVIITLDKDLEKNSCGDDNLKSVFREKFSTKYLHSFLKSMDKQMITLRMSPKKPLVIMYPLGGGTNIGHVHFILAPSSSE